MPTLDWLNRADAFTTAAQVPYRLLGLPEIQRHPPAPLRETLEQVWISLAHIPCDIKMR